MKKFILLVTIFSIEVLSQSLAPAQYTFMQGNNINSIFGNNGIYNYDKITFQGYEAGFIWPVTSPQRMTAIQTSGTWIAAKVGPQNELRMAVSLWSTQYTPGNIPVIGQVPPSSVCNDPSWRGYLVNTTDASLFNGGTRIKSAGGRPYKITYDPWAIWPVQKGAPYVEVNGIPGYQPAFNGDRPGIGNGMTARPEEILFMVYMDFTNCTDSIHKSELSLPGGTKPLGVEVQQIVFNFNCFPLRDMYFTKFRIINKSLLNWDSVFFTLANEVDIGQSWDEPTGCDTIRDLGFIYKSLNSDPIYGINPPAVGTRFMQSPLLYTGISTDTVKLPYDTLTGFLQKGMTSYNKFQNGGNECIGDPDNAVNAYNFMKGKDGCGNTLINWVSGQPTKFRYSGNACQRTGWFDSTFGQNRYIQNSGPFKMQSGDTQIVVLSFMITRDGGNNFQNVCALQSLSDSALKYFYNDFRTCIPIGIEPISTEIPQRYELFQNYPNPFNPMTKLKFQMPKSGFTRLVIFDVTGKEISILVNEQLKPGIYEINWDASNFPSGIYFYSIITTEFTQTKKMVSVK